MLYRTWLPLLFCGLLAFSPARAFEPFAGSQPLAILIQQDPHAPVLGAEVPRIAIYENGDVIYTRGASNTRHPIYLHAKLSFEGLSTVIDQLHPVLDALDLKRSYALSNTGDQSRALFYLHVDNKEVVTSVYGLTPASLHDRAKNAKASPTFEALLQLYAYLERVDFSDNEPWRPVYVEAMIWSYSDDEASIAWPKDWPDLHSPRAIKRPHGWSIFLDDSQEHDLAQLLSVRKDKSVVKIDGQKWSIAYRPVFPGEPIWRKAFSQITDE